MNKLVLNENKLTSGFICNQCNGYNDILNSHCIYCNAYSEIDDLFRFNIELSRNISTDCEVNFSMTNDDRVELHSKFYNPENWNPSERGLIESGTYAQLVAWEEELESIVVEAKAKLQRSNAERRDRQQKMSKEDRDKLISRPDMTVSEGLIAPALRKDRMSKADKMRQDMISNMNIPADMVDSLMASFSPDARESKSKDTIAKQGFSFVKEEPKSNNTQESLLEDLLSMVDLSSDRIDNLQEKLNTAMLLIPKTVSKEIPEKVIKLTERIESLKSKLVKEEVKHIVEIVEAKPFNPSKLFGK